MKEESLNFKSNNFREKEREILVVELKQLMREAFAKDLLGFSEKIVQKTEDLKNKYPGYDYESYEMWHILISSTPRERMKYFDFPDKDIEKFIRSESTSDKV